jgi:hypothetical protein
MPDTRIEIVFNRSAVKTLLSYKRRKLKTLEREIILYKPDIISVPLGTSVFEKYSSAEKTLDSIIIEFDIHGV